MGNGARAIGGASTALGWFASAESFASTAMGQNATASGNVAVAMGRATIARGEAAVAMGALTTANGDNTTAMGYNAYAQFPGSFVYADASSSSTLVDPRAHSFTVRAAGGVTFFTNAAATAGVFVNPGAGAWTSVSDVNRKHRFREESGETVLAKLARMPIRSWSYRAQDSTIRHLGPTAQDFRAAFGLGESELGITTVDADGVALLAIQALEQRTRELRAENVALRAELAALRTRLARLERGGRKP
jgi:hypothetical protein